MLILFILLGVTALIALASISQIQSEIELSGRSAISPDLPPFGRADFSDLPEDFSFVLVWNGDGSGFYDSGDGTLITENKDVGGGYVSGVLCLNQSNRETIRELLSSLNLQLCKGYCPPEIKGAVDGEVHMLTVRCGGEERTVFCSDDAAVIDEETTAERLGEYVGACRSILGIITQNQPTETILAG